MKPSLDILLRTSSTPIVRSLICRGTQMTDSVRKPVRASASRLNRLSCVVSFTIAGWPWVATHPAIPRSMAMR